MRILSAFIKKEFLQIIRDPSSIMIAFILPTLLSLIYMYGINMDSVNIRLGLKLDDANPQVMTLAKSFSNNNYIRTHIYDDKDAMYNDIVNSKLQGAVIIPGDFTASLHSRRTAQVLWSSPTVAKPIPPTMYKAMPAVSFISGWKRCITANSRSI